MAHRTVGIGTSIALTGTATTSPAFKVQSNVLRIVATGGNAYVAIGTDPVATAADYIVTTGQPETLAMLKQSQRVVGITKGTTTVLECPEGTQMPFQLGDRVSIDGANFAHYNVLLSNVQVIGKSRSAGVGGDFAEKITVKADTSGITTAFDAGCHASLFMSNRVSVISPNPTAAAVVYIQQVQTTGSA